MHRQDTCIPLQSNLHQIRMFSTSPTKGKMSCRTATRSNLNIATFLQKYTVPACTPQTNSKTKICSGPRNVVLFLARSQDSATILSECPYREDVPVLGVTDHAVFVEDSHDLLLSTANKISRGPLLSNFC
jgi:hypothetical protein